jgi:hypothetical protein
LCTTDSGALDFQGSKCSRCSKRIEYMQKNSPLALCRVEFLTYAKCPKHGGVKISPIFCYLSHSPSQHTIRFVRPVLGSVVPAVYRHKPLTLIRAGSCLLVELAPLPLSPASWNESPPPSASKSVPPPCGDDAKEGCQAQASTFQQRGTLTKLVPHPLGLAR